MTIPKPSYFKWREGRPRWEPGPGVRRLGFAGRDLKDEAGRWLDLGPAIAAADALNAEVAAARADGRRARKRPSAGGGRTFADLHRAWKASPFYADLAASTRRDYDSKASIILDAFGDKNIAVFRKADFFNWWERLHAERGHAMANGIVAVARLMLSYGELKGWIAANPARKLRLKSVPPRLSVWSPQQVAAFVAAADASGLPELADAALLALHTGQRQGDVLALEEPRIVGARVYFRQSKTGARVSVPFTRPLADRLADIRRRRAARTVVAVGPGSRIVARTDGSTYRQDRLKRDFRTVRAEVARTQPEFASKTFADLRDTAVTRLALAGCTMSEIRAITGHDEETIHRVIKHYLVLDERMADAAIAKLQAWLDEEGIAL